MFDKSKAETETKIVFLDVPYIYNPSRPEAQEFATALANCEEYDLFSRNAVKSIITFRWQLTYGYVVKHLYIPYLVYLMIYLAFTFLIFEKDETLFY